MTRSNPVTAPPSAEAESRNTPPLKLSREERKGVKVTRPDPETGELREKVVPANHFKRKLPRQPKLDASKITLIQRGGSVGATGRSVIYMLDHREAQITFWEAHACILTPEERRKLASGDSCTIVRPLEPEWEKGDLVDVVEGVEARVSSVGWSRTSYRTTFRVIDYRPLFMKRGAGYTRSKALSVPDSEQVMDDKLHRRLHAEASMGNAMRQSKGRVRQTKLGLEERLNEARKKNRRSTVRYLERQLGSIERKAA